MTWRVGESFLNKLTFILSLKDEEELAKELEGESFWQKELGIQGIIRN